MKKLILIVFAFTLIYACSDKQKEESQTAGDEKHRCQNCGMYTENWPNWEEVIEKPDQKNIYFCGPRCLFKYILEDSSRLTQADKIKMKDYYTLQYIDASKAFYVIGSDVLGPMGNELIPFSTKSAAKQFIKDHDGSKVLEFDEINLVLIKKLAQKSVM